MDDLAVTSGPWDRSTTSRATDRLVKGQREFDPCGPQWSGRRSLLAVHTANEIRCSFLRRQMLLYDCKHLMEPVMRYSKEHKLEARARIVKKASMRLRERGAHGIGVADLMKDAGLTHGGFYAHFDSREALVIEAFSHAMDRSTEHWRKLTEQTPPEKRLATIVESYLTPVHRDDPGRGCAIPTLAAEIARENPRTRKAFAAKLEQMIDAIAAQIPDLPRKAARKQAMAVIATMMGTMVLARVAGSGGFPRKFLAPGVRRCSIGRRRRSGRRRNPRPGRSPRQRGTDRQAVIPYDIGRMSWKCGRVAFSQMRCT